MIIRKCKMCGIEIEVPNNKSRRAYCPPCAAKRRVLAQRAYETERRRPAAAKTQPREHQYSDSYKARFTCFRCGENFQGSKLFKPKYCPDCAASLSDKSNIYSSLNQDTKNLPEYTRSPEPVVFNEKRREI